MSQPAGVLLIRAEPGHEFSAALEADGIAVEAVDSLAGVGAILERLRKPSGAEDLENCVVVVDGGPW